MAISEERQSTPLHKSRARYLGGKIIADLYIEVNPSLTVQAGRASASDIEKSIASEPGKVYAVTGHMEPMFSRLEKHIWGQKCGLTALREKGRSQINERTEADC